MRSTTPAKTNPFIITKYILKTNQSNIKTKARQHPNTIYTPATKSVPHNKRHHPTSHNIPRCPKYHMKYKYNYFTLHMHKDKNQTKQHTHPKYKPHTKI